VIPHPPIVYIQPLGNGGVSIARLKLFRERTLSPEKDIKQFEIGKGFSPAPTITDPKVLEALNLINIYFLSSFKSLTKLPNSHRQYAA
jgi:hypothetical protein